MKSSDLEINLIIKNLSDQCIVLYKDNQALQDLTKMITYVDNEKIQYYHITWLWFLSN
jgi:hypothetical protein